LKKGKSARVIISGGGTGGHVYPAIAIADAIKKLAPDTEFQFVGAKGKLEMEKVPQAGYPIEGLWISGFQRKLTFRNLLFPFKLFHSLLKAGRIIRKFKPDVAIGVGGYASGPTLEMAARKGIYTLLQEQNSFPGVTNRLLAKKANKICVAYDGMERFFPAENIVQTGNPVRSDFFQNLNEKKAEALEYFNFDENKKTIFIVGGSLGARTMNQAMEAGYNLLKSNPNIQVIWQIGKLYIDDFGKCETARLKNIRPHVFIDRMDLAYAAADVVIGRAGALTISELCLVGKPAILIPSPNVAEDHQTKNAMALVEKDAAKMVKDVDAKKEMLSTAIELLKNIEEQKKLSENISKLAKPNAAEEIAKVVLKYIQAPA
jgi:UDP-N-acetylglucosamine--N-acetylmuramyl-(pentapeptide) pyrophosphoryl-undecaprenol N-acetylglucosamine transferase